MDSTNLHKYPWYFGKITRQEAELQLTNFGENEGCFLVRESHSRSGQWTISVLDWDGTNCLVKHYLVESDDLGRFYLDDGVTFEELPDLIEYYIDNTNAVAFTLREPCPKLEELPDKDVNDYDLYEVATELCGDDFTKEVLLYSGNMSDVWKGHMESSSTTIYVAKTVKSHPDSEHSLRHEANMLKYLTHDNIVKFVGVLSRSGPFRVVFEYAGDSDLIDFLLRVDTTKISLMEQLSIALQVVSALKYCESKKCVHRNVKAKSVLVDKKSLSCRLSSFRHSRGLTEFGYYHATRTEEKLEIIHDGRVRWMAPEAAKYGRFSTASDVWSYAVFLVEIFTNGGLPYPGYLSCNILEQVDKGFRSPKPSSCPKEIYLAMMSCWSSNEASRPRFHDLQKILETYVQDNYETLIKMTPQKTQALSRYVPIQSGIKQKRTTVIQKKDIAGTKVLPNPKLN